MKGGPDKLSCFICLILVLLSMHGLAEEIHPAETKKAKIIAVPGSEGIELVIDPDIKMDKNYTYLDFNTLSTSINYDTATLLLLDFPSRELGKTGMDSMALIIDGHRISDIKSYNLALRHLAKGKHNLAIYRFYDGDTLHFKNTEQSKITFEVNPEGPREVLITNDAVALGLLLLLLGLVFYTAGLPAFKKFYGIVPALLLCYFLPALLNTFDIVDPGQSQLYYVSSHILLPASLILLCLSIDLKAIARLGNKALIMFFAATFGIVIGGPLALWLISLIDSSVLMGDDPQAIWRGLATVAGSWIGGGANQTAMKEIAATPDKLFSAMIIVDVFVANLLMSVLLFGTGHRARINKFFKADNRSIVDLEQKMENYQSSIARIPQFRDIMMMLGITFFLVSLSHVCADNIAPVIESPISSALKDNPDHWYKYLVSFQSPFFWLIVFATLFGIGLSFTRLRKFEGVGASKFGSVFLYILVATLGLKMNIFELIDNWSIFKVLIAIGLIWIIFHVLIIFIAAKLIKAPFFFVAVGSQANVGGAASAPVVASAFNPALAPVGVLLAVLGYAVGTVGAILCATMMQYVSNM